MNHAHTIACITALISALPGAKSQGNYWDNEVPAELAKAHVHELAAVYGWVYQVGWDSNVYFDFGGFFTEAVFTAVIPGANPLLSQLGQLEGKQVVILGRITTNSFGIPQIRVEAAERILVVGPGNQALPLDFDAEPPAQPTNVAPKEDATSWLSIFAADPDQTNTFVTLSGKTYQNSKVIQVEPDGLTIKYAPNGVGLHEIKISFYELPPNIQQMYGFDPQSANAYVNEQKSAAALSDNERSRQEWLARIEESGSWGSEGQLLYPEQLALPTSYVQSVPAPDCFAPPYYFARPQFYNSAFVAYPTMSFYSGLSWGAGRAWHRGGSFGGPYYATSTGGGHYRGGYPDGGHHGSGYRGCGGGGHIGSGHAGGHR